MKKKQTKPKTITITMDKLKSEYYIHYGHKIINFSNELLDFLKALGIVIKDENKR